jgi:hypothetical protein
MEYRKSDRRQERQALSLAKECYSMRLDLLTNATVVDDAIRFVSSNFKENLKSSNNKGDKEESNEPDYDEDQLGEQESREIATTNQVF